METRGRAPLRLAAAAGIVAVALAMAASLATSAAEKAPDHRAEPMAMRQEWIKVGLDEAANRLEIKASQQDAWEAFAKSVEALAVGHPDPPSPDADAATLARARADFVVQMGVKLSAVADATAKLQAVLGPDQRKTLDQIARHIARRHFQQRPDGPMEHGPMEQFRHGFGPQQLPAPPWHAEQEEEPREAMN